MNTPSTFNVVLGQVTTQEISITRKGFAAMETSRIMHKKHVAREKSQKCTIRLVVRGDMRKQNKTSGNRGF
jgi:hypothetical protein